MSVTHSGIAVSRAWEKRKLLREIGAKLPWSKSLGNGNLFWFEIYREIWEIGGLRNWYSSVISVLLNSHLFTNFFNLNLPLLNFCVLHLMNPFWFNDLHIFAGKVERTKQYRQYSARPGAPDSRLRVIPPRRSVVSELEDFNEVNRQPSIKCLSLTVNWNMFLILLTVRQSKASSVKFDKSKPSAGRFLPQAVRFDMHAFINLVVTVKMFCSVNCQSYST